MPIVCPGVPQPAAVVVIPRAEELPVRAAPTTAPKPPSELFPAGTTFVREPDGQSEIRADEPQDLLHDHDYSFSDLD